MADSTAFVFAPLIGLNNFVQYNDPGFGDRYLLRVGANNVALPEGSILPVTTGDGANPPPSQIVDAPQGRVGSLRTVFHIVVAENISFDDGSRLLLSFGLWIPPGVMGLARGSAAYLSDPANYPTFDPSRFFPVVQVSPVFSPYAVDRGAASPTPPPDYYDATLIWAAGVQITAGVVSYAAPSLIPAPILTPYGQSGMIGVNIVLENSFETELSILARQALQVVVDFDATGGN
jgi:hypothetical protein